jgi:hypothetical protein
VVRFSSEPFEAEKAESDCAPEKAQCLKTSAKVFWV